MLKNYSTREAAELFWSRYHELSKRSKGKKIYFNGNTIDDAIDTLFLKYGYNNKAKVNITSIVEISTGKFSVTKKLENKKNIGIVIKEVLLRKTNFITSYRNIRHVSYDLLSTTDKGINLGEVKQKYKNLEII